MGRIYRGYQDRRYPTNYLDRRYAPHHVADRHYPNSNYYAERRHLPYQYPEQRYSSHSHSDQRYARNDYPDRRYPPFQERRYAVERLHPRSPMKRHVQPRHRLPYFAVDTVAREILRDITAKFQNNIGPSQAGDMLDMSIGAEPLYLPTASPNKSALSAMCVMTPKPKFAVTKFNVIKRKPSYIQIDEEGQSSSSISGRRRSNTDPDVQIVHVELKNKKAVPVIDISNDETADDSIVILSEVLPNVPVPNTVDVSSESRENTC
ncbi:hypothetical protein QR680_012131 [Steinernema hermaphroditum]|uniref:Uncharacterized protein n=1 Tax=Steinernema hermaphroditum TaxID=289476 RepID=A0AA39I2L8_9BILA|nr:hypothetical protein QR680_012131 [Steinernema hermaphroditum]